MALNKTWKDLPVSLAPAAGETLADWHARIDAYAVANPGVLTPLSAVALEDLETRAQAELNTKAATVHKATHATGGTDVLTPADIGGLGAPGAHVAATRVLGTSYRPSTTRPVLVVATVTMTVPAGARALVYAKCDAVTPAVAIVARELLYNDGTSGPILTYRSITFLVPTGFYYMLQSLAVMGAPTIGIDQVVEQAL